MTTPTFVPSSEQQTVIAHRSGHLQVVACAGAGKTEAISRRVSTLIEEGVEPAQIVAFTFTERAATSLKTRITRRVAEAKGEAFLDRLGPCSSARFMPTACGCSRIMFPNSATLTCWTKTGWRASSYGPQELIA
jgi:hypothetical protein